MFNVRAYGLWESGGHLLASREVVKGRTLLKFPGSGVEIGEGPADTVVREFEEEMGLKVEVVGHVYTTDFYVPSFLDPKDQVISIYFQVRPLAEFEASQPGLKSREEGQELHWIDWKGIPSDTFPLPIDRVVLEKLQSGSLRLS